MYYDLHFLYFYISSQYTITVVYVYSNDYVDYVQHMHTSVYIVYLYTSIYVHIYSLLRSYC